MNSRVINPDIHLIHQASVSPAWLGNGFSTAAAAVESEPVLAGFAGQVGECGINLRFAGLAGFLTVNALSDQPLGLALPVSGGETARQGRVVPDGRVVRLGLAQAGEDLAGLGVVLFWKNSTPVCSNELTGGEICAVTRWNSQTLVSRPIRRLLCLDRRLLCAAGVDVVPEGGDLIPHALQVGRQGCDLAAVLIDLSGQRVNSQAYRINFPRDFIHHGELFLQWLESCAEIALGRRSTRDWSSSSLPLRSFNSSRRNPGISAPNSGRPVGFFLRFFASIGPR